MNELKVTRLNFGAVKYRLVNEDGCCLSSLQINKMSMGAIRRKNLGFPIKEGVFYLSDFVTNSSCRRKGYGRELLNHIKEVTKGQFIYLIVHSMYEDIFSDDKLVEFYKSVGFKVHEQKDVYQYYTWMVLDNR